MQQANMTGVVMGASAELRSPAAGLLTDLQVDRFESVEAGDTIGRIITTDPLLLDARLGVILADMELLSVGGGDAASHQRTLVDEEGLAVEVAQQEIELAAAELRYEQAQREVQRLRELQSRGLVAAELVERASSEASVLAAEIAHKSELVQQLRRRTGSLRMSRDRLGATDPATAAVRRQREELRLIAAEGRPAPLIAPIGGMVAQLFRVSGERVGSEEPVLTLRSSVPQYIVGYLPQPIRIQPEIGMAVTIRSRRHARQEFRGTLVEVGSQIVQMLEVDSLAALPAGRTGLPLKIAFTGETPPLMPGELVQLTLVGDSSE